MLNHPIALVLTLGLGLAACDITPDQQRMATGAAIGGGLGLLTAEALGADTEWVIVSTVAGAAVGTLVARNTATGQCAYANGDGTYYQAPCP